MKKFSHRGVLSALLLTGIVTARGASLVYPDFSDIAGLQINGDAGQVGSVLRLTPAVVNQSGSAFSTNAITLTTEVSFSTFFSFQISAPGGIGDGDGTGADGLVFVVQTQANNVGSIGGGIGYQGIPESLGIEFDTYFNGGVDPAGNGNHVGINLNGSVTSVQTAAVANRMNVGDIWYAWVDYAGNSDTLEVRLSGGPARPASPLLSYNVDLTEVLDGADAFVGFTSGTGGGFGNHDILSWEFRDDFSPVVDPPGGAVPDTGGSLLLLLSGITGIAALKKRLKK